MNDLDQTWLERAAVVVSERLPDVTSLLVSRRGHLAFERYFGIRKDEPQDTQSVTKSLVSLVLGVAVERGVLSVDQPILQNWSYAASVVNDPRWHQVTVGHLLTMTSGLPSEMTDPVYDDAWFLNADPLQFTLEQTLQSEPGEAFHYSNAGTHLLGALLAHTVKQSLDDFAQQVLLTPLGIPRRPWGKDAQGRVWGSGTLHLTPREMLRIGQLVLQEGSWQGKSVLPAAWISQMTCLRSEGYTFMEGLPGYGWLWWLPGPDETPGFYATGYGGQYIAVFPALDLVVVMTGQVSDHPNHRHVIAELARHMSASEAAQLK
ncbi:serine hydrolase [Deinococcus radiomollis]|uniref:serine hydrolase domain-containing protein n=1 Tax=Deinococcus radiomollis TaxID=468916 RepID=UPI00389157C1